MTRSSGHCDAVDEIVFGDSLGFVECRFALGIADDETTASELTIPWGGSQRIGLLSSRAPAR